LIALALCAAVLGACGKRGAPEPAGKGDEVTWPKTYPAR